jgi:uncharacterized membrane protein YeaQ/YmgE (transglycosylase-associated protein family)
VLILGIILFGLLVGWLAQFILGRGSTTTNTTDWTMAFVAGLGGSFVGGLLASLLAGDGLSLKPSGLIGSIAGALIITAIWQWYATRKRNAAQAAEKQAARSGRHH